MIIIKKLVIVILYTGHGAGCLAEILGLKLSKHYNNR